MENFPKIYVDNPVCKWHIDQLGLKSSQDITAKLALYHVPFPYDQGQGKLFESRVDQSLIHSDRIVVLCSELHEDTANFIRKYHNHKIKFFLCGAVEGIESFDWMDWFITSSYFYKTNPIKVLDRLMPYQPKSKTFDILLGQNKEHRNIIYNYINSNNFNDQVIMTYISHHDRITANKNNAGWIWEDQGLEIIDTDLKWTVGQVKYYGQQMSLSQVLPIEIYNQTAYSLVCETNFADNFVFHTEKIVKPILGRRLFVVFAGRHYLRNLHRLGFRTFNNIIDESYDEEANFVRRGQMICNQISYLIKQDQRKILDLVRPIVDHNYDIIMNTDWQKYIKELRAVLLDQPVKN